MATSFKPKITHYKIMITIQEINEKGYYPLVKGVLNILKGEVDDETISFNDVSTYRSLISYPSKKLSRYILMLLRYGYLKKIYDENTDNLYLAITEYGEAQLLRFKKKHKTPFKKKEVIKKPNFIKIEK